MFNRYQIDVWHLNNKFGANIQTALDYLILYVDPSIHQEDPSIIVPLLYDAIDIYGDIDGRYSQAIYKFNHGDMSPLFSSLWREKNGAEIVKVKE